MINESIIYITLPNYLYSGGWQDAFVSKVKLAISKTVKVKCRYIIKSAEDDLQAVQKNIEQSDVFIAILDEIEKSDNAYLNELYAISDLIQKKVKDSTVFPVYKINLAPDDLIQQPVLFQSIRSFNFYEKVNRRNNHQKLEFSEQRQSNKAWNLILDLSFDLKGMLKSINNSNEVGKTQRKFVYLGACSSDLLSYRDELKREFQHFGYAVLPLSDTNSQSLNNDELIENLEKCKIVLQLLGVNYGKIEKGERVSLVEKENVSINNYASTHPEIERFIWVPEFLKRMEQRQVLFLNRIKQKESSCNTHVLESSFDVLKDTLLQRLNKSEPVSEMEDNKASVYYISKESIVDSNLQQLLRELKIEVKTIDFRQPVELFKRHIELLKTTDNVLINWESEDKLWLRSKLSDLVKAPGMGRKGRFSTITIVYPNAEPDISGFENFLRVVKMFHIDDKVSIKGQFSGITE